MGFKSSITVTSATSKGGVSDPRTAKFGDRSFWEEEYASQSARKKESEAFEWFLPYDGALREHLLPLLKSLRPGSRLLHVGCGTSEMGPRLATEPGLDVQVTDLDNIPTAVRMLRARHVDLANYSCHEADALNLPFADGSFDAIVDKGTLDALLCRSVEDAQGLAGEVHRVLSKGGIFVQITSEAPEARLELLTTRDGRKHEDWSRSIFKEIADEVHSTYFMYILFK